jgi:hypothetical protein
MKPEEKQTKKTSEPIKSEKKGEQKSRKSAKVQLPLLVELTFSISIMMIVLIDAAVIVISITNGASWTDLILRTVVSTIVMGIVLLLLAQTVSSGVIAAAQDKMKAGHGSASSSDKTKVIEA